MSLLQEWREFAYGQDTNTKKGQMFWAAYFELEKGIYENLLGETAPVKGTVEELADKYEVSINYMVGFLDGINESLLQENPIQTMDKDTEVSLEYNAEKLYYNMVAARADWLYELPEWNNLLSEEKRKNLYKEQRKSGTLIKDKKIGRNDPCPCGSGKKYKQCCAK